MNRHYDLGRIRRLGILRFESPPQAQLGVEDLFAKHLIEGGYTIVERARLEPILGEHRLGSSGLFAPRTVKELGRILGVDAVLMGQVSSYEAGSRSVLLVKTSQVRSEPVLHYDQERQADGSFALVPRAIGTRVHHDDNEVPQVVALDSRVGLVAKLVDVETGEVIWVGSATGQAAEPLAAAESAVSLLVRRLRKDWSPELVRR